MKSNRSAPYKLEQVRFREIDSPLLKWRRNITSQNGEDGIIEHLISCIGHSSDRYVVEFGAWDGKHLSNVYNLITKKGYSGCLIEADQERFDSLRANFGGSSGITCLNKIVHFEGNDTLDNILANIKAPLDIDVLSIDIDGVDWFVWQAVRLFTPRIVVIEFNPSIPNDVAFVQARDMTISQGCSLLSLVQLGKVKGYELVAATSCNAIFVIKEFFPVLGLKNNHIMNLFVPHCDGRIFHGYDSEVFSIGMPRLIWSNVEVSHDDLQILPNSLRRVGFQDDSPVVDRV